MSLQSIVSELAERLHRPVALNDFDLNLLAASAHDREVDEYRVRSILTRRTPPEVVQKLRTEGFLERPAPFFLPEAFLPGQQSRLCIPIQLERRNIAFLWIVLEPGAQPTAEGFSNARAAAAQITHILSERSSDPRVEAVVDNTRQLQQLFHADSVIAGYAVAEWAAERHVAEHTPIAITVMPLIRDPKVRRATETTASPAVRNDFNAVIKSTLTALEDSDLFGIIDHMLVVVSARPSWEQIPKAVERAIGGLGATSHYWLRSSGASLTRDWRNGLQESYQEATYAARVAGLIPEAPRYVRYDHLGSLVLFRHLAWTEASVALLSPEAATLNAQGTSTNATTLLTLLRVSGDVQRACAELKIHRSTLYYRLDRCRTLIGDALEDGWRRVSLYLGLVLAELIRCTKDLEAEGVATQ